ncbi:glucose 1-dehydrogenase [Panacibacter ginsenosidivorans]|uniref:Glucose 1-dehydrogenase n=1 Tax=Panacibacter ginsenosidivorans TaxID=1813871 RepID=A0A5B8V6C5_9BACT|nr:glucose 1-dehydrogenase [Panacibacter ginsenosidivorans]QEC66665.1 glucose 1-dehydrogenase [Panacibacter ginsenosidivorans]
MKNKTVIITGASKGIGLACATLFYEQGANVALLDISPDKSGINDERWFYTACDVSKNNEVQHAIQNTHQKFGRIDFLINNAGIQRYGNVTDTAEDEWDLVMNVNLKSQYLCAKHAIPFMQQQGSGVVINVSSVQAFVSQQNVAAYTTAKTALLGLTRSIAVDYAPNIRCVAVCPGTIDTPMLRDSIALSPDPAAVMQECIDMHPVHRIGKPEEVAELIYFLCSDKASFITGQAFRIDGGLGITIAGSKKDS